jgi:hypothetical protein
MAYQNAAGVNITGGTISGANHWNIGTFVPAQGPDLVDQATWDWNAPGSIHAFSAAGRTIHIANPHPGQMCRIWVRSAGALNIMFNGAAISWANAHPVWGGGGTLVTLICLDTNWVVGWTSGIG